MFNNLTITANIAGLKTVILNNPEENTEQIKETAIGLAVNARNLAKASLNNNPHAIYSEFANAVENVANLLPLIEAYTLGLTLTTDKEEFIAETPKLIESLIKLKKNID